MRIEIVTRNVENEATVREYVQRKVHFALDRISARVKQVTVRLEDETRNSPAFDGLCRIDVVMHPRGHVHVSSDGDSVFDCVLRGVRKMEHAIKHDIDRNRRSSRIRHQQKRNQEQA